MLLTYLHNDLFIFSFISTIAQCTVPALTDQLTSGDCTAAATIDHGTSCTYMCASGYTLQGSGTAMCTSGTLTPPTCEGKLKFCHFPWLLSYKKHLIINLLLQCNVFWMDYLWNFVINLPKRKIIPNRCFNKDSKRMQIFRSDRSWH